MFLAGRHIVRILAVIVGLSGLVLSDGLIAPQQAQARQFSAKDVRADLKTLRTWLRTYHPNLYTHSRPRKLNARFNAIMQSVKGPMDFWNASLKA